MGDFWNKTYAYGASHCLVHFPPVALFIKLHCHTSALSDQQYIHVNSSAVPHAAESETPQS